MRGCPGVPSSHEHAMISLPLSWANGPRTTCGAECRCWQLSLPNCLSGPLLRVHLRPARRRALRSRHVARAAAGFSAARDQFGVVLADERGGSGVLYVALARSTGVCLALGADLLAHHQPADGDRRLYQHVRRAVRRCWQQGPGGGLGLAGDLSCSAGRFPAAGVRPPGGAPLSLDGASGGSPAIRAASIFPCSLGARRRCSSPQCCPRSSADGGKPGW